MTDLMRLLTNSSTKHGRAILRRMPPSRRVQGAELGVCRGVLSAYLLGNRPGLGLCLVDHYQAHDPGSEAATWSREHAEPCNQLTQVQQDANRAAAELATAKYGHRVRWIVQDTIAAADLVDDRTLDFVFVDADHRMESALADIRAWAPKVKPGGWIGGHDYKTPGMGTGVDRAVSLLVESGELIGLELDDFYTWFAGVGGAS